MDGLRSRFPNWETKSAAEWVAMLAQNDLHLFSFEVQ